MKPELNLTHGRSAKGSIIITIKNNGNADAHNIEIKFIESKNADVICRAKDWIKSSDEEYKYIHPLTPDINDAAILQINPAIGAKINVQMKWTDETGKENYKDIERRIK